MNIIESIGKTPLVELQKVTQGLDAQIFLKYDETRGREIRLSFSNSISERFSCTNKMSLNQHHHHHHHQIQFSLKEIGER